MTNQKLIKKLKILKKEIKNFKDFEEHSFFICYHSKIKNICSTIVPLLRKYGELHIKGFISASAFLYLRKRKMGHKVYNNQKLNHIDSFIEWLKENDYKILNLEE